MTDSLPAPITANPVDRLFLLADELGAVHSAAAGNLLRSLASAMYVGDKGAVRCAALAARKVLRRRQIPFLATNPLNAAGATPTSGLLAKLREQRGPARAASRLRLLLLAGLAVIVLWSHLRHRAPAADQADSAPLLTAYPSTPAREQPRFEPALVTRVIDGDTIVVRGRAGDEERVRLIGVDAPELSEPGGREATGFVRRFVEAKRVHMRRGAGSDDRDRHDRLLRYVYLDDGTLLNADVIASGHARALDAFPHEFSDRFLTLEGGARVSRRGLWSVARR